MLERMRIKESGKYVNKSKWAFFKNLRTMSMGFRMT